MDSALKVFPSSTPKTLPLPGLSSSLTDLSIPRYCYFLEEEAISWTSFVKTCGKTHSREYHMCFVFFYMNEKEKKVNTGRRHRHILGSQASRQEMPRGLAPCSLRFFFFFLKWKSNVATSWWWKEQHLKIWAAPLVWFPGMEDMGASF